ncbi:hypothetical protein B9G69_001880 [Bdellovibrio sp. SKB1291214]|uniref:hypothetical protein n=1 Tax=Bdellovibrio sp. SKB1291214 TaxID=1732569 RepID=UPI000B51B37F|nr:hypothetical protein [Bdellovibrio sp. SKB1291214]UYL09320.1 hypothetical protein B9G69_001880 [Bdellovibrio sp. SKB1291214]
MFKSIIPFALAATLSSYANAQLITPTDDPVIVKKSQSAIEEDSSEHKRMGKSYEVSLTPVAIGPIPGLNTGVNIATYLTRNAAVIFGYSLLVGGRSCWGAISCSDKGYAFELYYRQFFGNSFYVAGGLDQRYVSSHGSDDFTGESYSFDGETTAASVVIGNQWHWQRFVLGCDWFGLSVPISSRVSNVKTRGSYGYDFEDAKNALVTGTRPMALRVHVGMTF